MNNKIEELVERSYGTIQFEGNHCYYDEHFSIEKFAELIVKECIASCLEVKDEYLKQGRDAQEEVFLVAAVDDCISNINQHFGVE